MLKSIMQEWQIWTKFFQQVKIFRMKIGALRPLNEPLISLIYSSMFDFYSHSSFTLYI